MSKCKMVEGGTHNNFVSYSGPVEFNGVPGISKEKQHELIADATAKFIFRMMSSATSSSNSKAKCS
jgi:hypothetical protein